MTLEDHEPQFTFVRAQYNGLGGWGYYKSWQTDWPKADRQFILGIKRLTNISVADSEKTIAFTDPEIFKYPFVYAVEVGHWDLSEAEVAFLELQKSPREFQAWCREARVAWSRRTGIPLRRAEA